MDWNYIHTGERQARALARDPGKALGTVSDMRAQLTHGHFATTDVQELRFVETTYTHLAELEYGLKRVIGVWASLEDRRSVCNAHQQQRMTVPFRIPPTEHAMQIVALQIEIEQLQISIEAINEHIKMFQRFILTEKRRLAE